MWVVAATKSDGQKVYLSDNGFTSNLMQSKQFRDMARAHKVASSHRGYKSMGDANLNWYQGVDNIKAEEVNNDELIIDDNA